MSYSVGTAIEYRPSWASYWTRGEVMRVVPMGGRLDRLFGGRDVYVIKLTPDHNGAFATRAETIREAKGN